MTDEEYVQGLGVLIANFHSLEFALRMFLQKLPTALPFGIQKGVDLYSYPVGSWVPLNEMTNYESLGDLIDRFNDEMKRNGKPVIDRTLVDLRDAVAHGRVSGTEPSVNTMRLLKFSRPINGRVQVTFNAALSADWFTTQKKGVLEAAEIIGAGGEVDL